MSLWVPCLGVLLIWYLNHMLSVNSPLAAGDLEEWWSSNLLMLVSPLVIIWMSTAREWLVGPGIWSQGAQNPGPLQYKFPWEAGVWRLAGEQPPRGLWGLLAGFAPQGASGSPVPSQLTGFSVQWLATWQLEGVTVVQGPTLVRF